MGYWTTGVVGNAYNFDGEGACSIPLPALDGIAGDVTVAFWAKGNDDMPIYGEAFMAVGTNSRLQASMTTYSQYVPGELTVFVAGQGFGDQTYAAQASGAGLYTKAVLTILEFTISHTQPKPR